MARRVRLDIRQASRTIALVFVGVAAANVLLFALATRPSVRRLTEVTEEASPRLAALKARATEVEAREAYLAGLKQAQADLETLAEKVLSSKKRRMIEVQFEVDRLARQFGVNLDRMEIENEPIPAAGVERFAMTLPLEGGYANLRRFLRAVEESEKFLIVEHVALGTGKEGGVLLQLNITLATYFDLPEEAREPVGPVRTRRPDAAEEGA